jgi:hypothetical protein
MGSRLRTQTLIISLVYHKHATIAIRTFAWAEGVVNVVAEPGVMETKACPQCGASSAEDAKFCAGCGASFSAAGETPTATQAEAPAAAPYVAPPQQPQYAPTQTPTGKEGFAIASLILGILSLFFMCVWYLAIPMAILAIIFGSMGKSSIQGTLATIGMILGVVGIVIPLLIVGLIAMGLWGLTRAVDEERLRNRDWMYR